MTLFSSLLPSTVVGESLAKTTYSPMVAFVCDKGAMHMDPDLSWHTDPNTSCLDEKRSILEYCKQVYPSLDVTNIVEASESVTIRGWCPLGQKDCESPQTFLVQPYRSGSNYHSLLLYHFCPATQLFPLFVIIPQP